MGRLPHRPTGRAGPSGQPSRPGHARPLPPGAAQPRSTGLGTSNESRLLLLILVAALVALAGIPIPVFLGLKLVGLATQNDQPQQIAAGTGERTNAGQDAPEHQSTASTGRQKGESESRSEARRTSLSENPLPPTPLPASGARGADFGLGSEKRPLPEIETAPPQPADRRPRRADADADSQLAEPDDNLPPGSEPQPPRKHDPFEDVNKRNRVLALPELGRSGGDSSEPQELAKLFVPPDADCRLAILGSDKVLDKGRSFQVNRNDAHGTRTWTVIQKVKNVPVTQDIGSFTLTDDSLKFQWDENAKHVKLAPKLQYCVLDIRVGEQSERCTLTRPREVEPAKIVPLTLPARADIDLAPDTVPNLDLLRLDLQPQGFPKHEIKPRTGIMPGGTSTIKFVDGSSLEVVIEFEFNNQHQALAFETFLNVRKKIGGFEQAGRQRLTQGVLDNHRKVWTEEKVAGLKAQLDKIQGRIQEIEKLAEQHCDERAKLKAEINRRARRAGAPDYTREQHDQFVREINDKIAEWAREDAVRHTEMLDLEEKVLPPLKEAFDKADGQLRWRQAVEKFVDELADKGDLQYRVYVEIEGQKVGLVQTKGFQQTDGSERDE